MQVEVPSVGLCWSKEALLLNMSVSRDNGCNQEFS